VLVWKPLVETLLTLDIPGSVLAAFIAFISGPPFGFLITQVWYMIFDKRFRWIRNLDDEPVKTLVSYGVVEDVDKVRIVNDYLYNKYAKSYRKVLSQRINLYHSICSTCVALVLGFFTGYLLRSFFRTPLPIFWIKDWWKCSLWQWWDLIHLTIWCLLPIVLVILYVRQRSIRNEVKKMQLFIVKTFKDKINELPDEYKKVEPHV